MPLNWVPLQQTVVYSVDGHLIGRVAEGWPSEYASSRAVARAVDETGMGYFRMTGFKGGDLYVPFNAMSDYTDERIKLRFTKNQIAKKGWGERPAELPPS